MRGLLVAALTLVVLGCQPQKPPGDLPALFPVTGKIVRGNVPVSGGVVQFRPDPDSPNIVVNAEVRADGGFELKTLHALSQKTAPGAPAGHYKVMYLPPATGENNMAAPPTMLTQLFTVKEGQNEFTIEITKK